MSPDLPLFCSKPEEGGNAPSWKAWNSARENYETVAEIQEGWIGIETHLTMGEWEQARARLSGDNQRFFFDQVRCPILELFFHTDLGVSEYFVEFSEYF